MEGFITILVGFDGEHTYRAYSVEARAVEAARAATKTHALAMVVQGRYFHGGEPPMTKQAPHVHPATSSQSRQHEQQAQASSAYDDALFDR